MSALCDVFDDGSPPRHSAHFDRIFSETASAVNDAGRDLRGATLPPDMLDNLELLVTVTVHALHNRLAISPAAFASLQNVLKEVQEALETPAFREGIDAKDVSRLTKGYQNLTKAVCAIAVQNDGELRALLTGEATHGACG